MIQEHQRGAGARLAAELERLGEQGIRARSSGQCLAQAAATGRHRHDRSCAALGVPLPRIARLLRRSGHRGAAMLLQEAADAAVSEIGEWGTAWHPDGALDAWRAAIRARITPRGPGHPGGAAGAWPDSAEAPNTGRRPWPLS